MHQFEELEKAMQWFILEDIQCYHTEGELYIKVNDFDIQVSSSEISYRADLWQELNN
jgi:hypothetical protein